VVQEAGLTTEVKVSYSFNYVAALRRYTASGLIIVPAVKKRDVRELTKRSNLVNAT
jgi:hypothetical protein